MNDLNESFEKFLDNTYKKSLEDLFPIKQTNGVLIRALKLVDKNLKHNKNSEKILKTQTQVASPQKNPKNNMKNQIKDKRELFFTGINGFEKLRRSSFLKTHEKENFSVFLGKNIQEFELEMPNNKKIMDDQNLSSIH